MPELPEVETVVRGLAQRVSGDVIESVWIGRKPEPLKSPAHEIALALEGANIERVERAGKHIILQLNRRTVDGEAQWIVHLGMTGQLLIVPPGSNIAKHTHLIARLRSGRELRFIDPRRFGRLAVRTVRAGEKAHEWVGGHEPLEITPEQFVALFRKRKTPIKSALLNQKLLRGVGNIYADESLFRAGIRPRHRAASLTPAELKALRRHLQTILKQAIAAGGSSISDFVDVGGESGYFQFRHRVYGREGEPCVKCKSRIKRLVIAGRSAHYCPKCQK